VKRDERPPTKREKIRFSVKGEGLTLEEMPLPHLIQILQLIERAVTSFPSGPEVATSESTFVSLTGVFESSAGFEVSAPPPLVAPVREIAIAVERGETAKLPRSVVETLHELSAAIVKRRWTLQIEPRRDLNIPAATISEALPVAAPPKRRPLEGTTTLFARCVRVGGREPRAELLLLTSTRLLNIAVSQELARELARFLYDEVVLEGSASWDADTLAIESFVLHRVGSYRKAPLELAFQELKKIANGELDGLDALALVRELRGDAE